MSKEKKDRQYQKGLIITDDVAIEPILDFDLYRNAIANIIKNSYPKFTIGIFGDWGTGKTTLMNAIYEILEENKNDIVRVRFEAWRYEREEQFALIPLLKTIAFALPEEEKFKNLKRKLKRGAINFIKKTPDIISSIISKNINEEAGVITKEAFNSFKTEFNSKMELLAEVDRDTLYFDGFDDIKNEINNIQNDYPNFKIVVFVDDLDRCSPIKALEVLESIKVFLGMEGFIYIIGLSHDIVTKLIDIEYEKKGVKGEQYIKKIIQIPITLPKWIKYDIVKLINYLIEKEIINTKYKKIFNLKNIDLVSDAIENNPREIKRFLNNFIVAFEIFSSKENFNANELLMIQVIQLRWIQFYILLIYSENDFRKKLLTEINKYTKFDEERRLQLLDSDEVKVEESERFDMKIRKVLRDFKGDVDLWKVLEKNFAILENIQDWNIYRRAIEVTKESISQIQMKEFEALALLKSGSIEEFNKRRSNVKFPILNLSNDRLVGANLVGANLTDINLTNTNLTNAILISANLTNANLTNTNLVGANLVGSNLIEADLIGANLTNANLSRTYLLDANLVDANLTNVNLTGADLMGATLFNSVLYDIKNYENLIINEKTKFDNSITNNQAFVEYLQSKNPSITFKKMEGKMDLRTFMANKGFLPMNIDYIMNLDSSIIFILQPT